MTKSPIRYAGGKSRAIKHILPIIPKDVTVVSPFMGGGSVEIALASRGQNVEGWDIFEPLMNYWAVQINSPEDLANLLQQWNPDPKTYKDVKERLRQHWVGENILENSLELAAHYFFNHNLSYGPGFLGWQSSIYRCPARYARMVDRVRNFRVKGLSTDVGDFGNVISASGNKFLYCDPPYHLGEDGKMFKGIYPQRNFPIHHNNFDHEKLRDLLLNHDGDFLLSYNDSPTIRNFYRGYRVIEVGWHYSLGSGETRIGKNRREAGTNHVKKSHELLICNF